MNHDRPSAALLVIGNELLSGHTADQNGPHLLSVLRERGIEVKELRVIADSEPAIADAIVTLKRRCTRVLCTGGIGPTHDDVTVRALAHAFGKPVVVHAELEARVKEIFGDPAPAAAMRLAEVPEGAEVLLDARALVPIITLGNVTLLPGVPSFVRTCLQAALGDWRGMPFVVRELQVTAHETAIAAPLDDVAQRFDDVSIGSYPQFSSGKVVVRLRIEGSDRKRVEAATKALRSLLGVKS